MQCYFTDLLSLADYIPRYCIADDFGIFRHVILIVSFGSTPVLMILFLLHFDSLLPRCNGHFAGV